MLVVTAPEEYELGKRDLSCFLAGGITNCHNWQQQVIDTITGILPEQSSLVLFNPRRENFPINDPSAAYKQIVWEYEQIEKTDIFSMYFCAGESDQPICMYELGRNILRMQQRFPADWEERIVISVENGYKRKRDVIIQTQLATSYKVNIQSGDEDQLLDYHTKHILRAYRYILSVR